MFLKCSLHSLPFQRHTDRYKDAQSCITVVPDTLHIPTKLQTFSPTESKGKLTPSNSTDHLLPGLKCSPHHYHFGYNKCTQWHTSR